MQNDNNLTEISDSVIFSVSEVTLHIRQVIETQIDALYIIGEISNFVKHSSGHIYFNLKDDNAVIRCVFFRNQNYLLNFQPENGNQVICFGKISVFEKSGQYQVLVQNVFPYGRGALQQKFEQLKLKLKNEGLFGIERKKPLPKYPDSVGIITSPTGAALQDVLNILERRYPCKVIVFQSLMQGGEAPGQVIKGLNYFNESKKVDLIIITRGGGSQEDLFCFNDEELARAINTSALPVVSAIGHEIDFTIADFVADFRAPTPSAAAELITPNISEVYEMLDNINHTLRISMLNGLHNCQNELHKIHLNLLRFNPERVWHNFQQRIDNAVLILQRFSEEVSALKLQLSYKQQLFQREVINRSKNLVQIKKHKIEMYQLQISIALNSKLTNIRHRMELIASQLDELSPHAVLARGYSLVKKKGKIINTVKELDINDKLDLILSDGSVQSKVESVIPDSRK